MPRLGGGDNHGLTGTAGRRGNPNNAAADLIEQVSNELDDKLFNPLYETENQTSELEKALTAKLAGDYKAFTAVEEKLKPIKVAAAAACVLCLGLTLSNFAAGRPVNAFLYAAAAHDAFKVSNNCFVRKYLNNATKRLGGSFLEAVGNTLLSSINSAIFGKPDVLQRLQQDVQWDTLLDWTFTKKVLEMLPRAAPAVSEAATGTKAKRE